MADELEGLSEKMLRGMLPGLYPRAQTGDQRAIDTVLRIIQRLDKNTPPPTPTNGFTAPANAPGQTQSRASRKEFEEWLDLPVDPADKELAAGVTALNEAYWRQLDSGENNDKWDWRKHAYIAWASIPKSLRWPKTMSEFADLVGLTNTATIRKWRAKDPEISERIASLPKQLLSRHIADVMNALVAVASDPIPQAHQDRKLFLEITGQYNPKGALDIKGLLGTVELDDPLDDDDQRSVEEILREAAERKKK